MKRRLVTNLVFPESIIGDWKVRAARTFGEDAGSHENAGSIERVSIVALYFLLFAAALTVGIAGFRIGLDFDGWSGLAVLGGLAFTMAGPIALLSFLAPDRRSVELILGPAIILALLVFLGLSFLGIAGLIVTMAAAIAATLRVVWIAARAKRGSISLAVAGFVLVFIPCFVGLAGSRYGSFVADYLALGGRASADAYFHWSLTNALRYFGEVGIGIDGIHNIKYYPMAHFVSARIAELSGGDSGWVFILTRAIFFAPLCLAACTFIALAVDRNATWRPATLAFLVTVLVFFYHCFGRDFFDSESHALGLAFFALLVPTAFQAMTPVADRRLAWFIWIALLLCLAVTTATKVTTGFVVLCLFGYVALRAYHKKPLVMLAIWVSFAAVAFLVYRQVIDSSMVAALNADIPGNFGIDWRWYYPILHYSLAVLALFALLVTACADGPVWQQFRAGKLPLLEMLGVVLIAATLPALLFPIPAGGGYYMTHPQMWIALPIFLVIGIPFLARELFAFKNSARQRRVWHRSLISLGIIIAMAVALIQNVPDVFMERLAQMFSQSSFVRTDDPSFFESRKKKAVRDDMERTFPLLGDASYYWPERRPLLMENLVGELKELHLAHGNRLAAYASPKAQDFWTLTDNCFLSSMMLPGMSAVPLIDGLPPLSTGCAQQQTVSYSFNTAAARTSDEPLDDDALCQLAKNRGFDVVARIESLAAVDRVVTCTP